MTRPDRVVKVGGSLLARGPAPLRSWLEEAAAVDHMTRFVLVVGGGEAVDTLRRLDAIESLNQEHAHWLAIDLMAVNARVVADWLGLRVIDGAIENLQTGDEPAVVFDARRFLRDEEPKLPGERLPIGWETTSDSIAARVAAAIGAPLTLLKSLLPESDDWATLAAAGYIDAAFPRVASQVASIDFIVLPSTSGASAG